MNASLIAAAVLVLFATMSACVIVERAWTISNAMEVEGEE